MSRMLRRSHKELEKMDWNQQLNLRKRVCSFEIGDLQLVPTTQRYVPRNWVGRYITVRDWALQWAPKSSHGKVIDIAPWSFVCYILLNWYLFLISIDPSKHQIRVVSFFRVLQIGRHEPKWSATDVSTTIKLSSWGVGLLCGIGQSLEVRDGFRGGTCAYDEESMITKWVDKSSYNQWIGWMVHNAPSRCFDTIMRSRIVSGSIKQRWKL